MSHFQTTSWSLVLRARADDTQARHALEQLCRIYRPPVLAYIRRNGIARQESEDLTQAFFARFLEQALHVDADPLRGRFRALLLTALKHFLINSAAYSHAAKRGGSARLESLDGSFGDGRIAAGTDSPERAFELGWATAVIEQALLRLRTEAKATGKLALFDRLREFLLEKPVEADYDRLATELGLRRNTVAVAVHRLRQRLRDQVRIELAETVSREEDVEVELEALRATLGGALH